MLFGALCCLRKVPTTDARDQEIRFQYHEVKGPRPISSISKSKVVLEPAAYFCAKMWATFAVCYGDKMSQEVMVVCPFAETLEWRNRVIDQKLSVKNELLAAKGRPALSRDHFPRIISSSDDKDIQSTIVIIDPANQDGTKSGQGFFKQDMVKTAISCAKEAVIIIGNSCRSYPDWDYNYRWREMDSALNAAHQWVSDEAGLLKCEDYYLSEPLVSLSNISEELLLDEEREAYAKLSDSDAHSGPGV